MSVRRDLREGSEPGMQSRGWVRGAGKGDCGDKIILLLAESFSSSLFFFLPQRAVKLMVLHVDLQKLFCERDG